MVRNIQEGKGLANLYNFTIPVSLIHVENPHQSNQLQND